MRTLNSFGNDNVAVLLVLEMGMLYRLVRILKVLVTGMLYVFHINTIVNGEIPLIKALHYLCKYQYFVIIVIIYIDGYG